MWELELDSGATRPLTAHDEKVGLLRRAPDDDRLLYAIDAGGDERHQLWLLEADGPRALTSDPAVIHGAGAWSPDGTGISFTANDRDPAHFDALAVTLATGARTRLHQGMHEATVGAWAADGRSVFIEDHSTNDQRVRCWRPAGAAARCRARAPTRFASLRWDGDGLLGLSNAGRLAFMALCRVGLDGGVTPVFAAPTAGTWRPGRCPPPGCWRRSRTTAATPCCGSDRGPGERPAVALPPGVAADLAWSGDGRRLAFACSAPTRPSGLWLWEDGAARPVWEPECGLPLRDFALVEWAGFDGLAVPGWLALPAGEAPAAGWPAVVWVHGGPAAQSRAGFRADMQALLDGGYAVLMPNVRGTTGYGRAYMDADDVAQRLDSVHDLAAGRHWLAARPEIDAGRIAVMGQSYGGYMVLAAVTRVSGAVALRDRLLRHRRLRHAAGRDGALAAGAPGGGVRRPGAPPRAVRPHLADPPRRPDPRADAGAARHARPAGGDRRKRAGGGGAAGSAAARCASRRSTTPATASSAPTTGRAPSAPWRSSCGRRCRPPGRLSRPSRPA